MRIDPSDLDAEIAYRLITEDSELVHKVRDNVIVGINPASDPDGRDRVEGRWIRTGLQTVGVHVAAYDHARPLVIDPLILYSTYLGGNSNDWGMRIALDPAGNIYVAGGTTSTNFPGVTPRTSTGNAAFVTKLTASGQIIYSTYFLETDERGATGIAVDTLGNAYVTGGTSLWRATGSSDVFVAKLDPFGRVTRPAGYFFTFGGQSVDWGNRVAVDGAGNAYVTGVTDSANFPTTPGAFRRTFAGNSDGFVAKVNASGTGFVYSTLLGGRGLDSPNDIVPWQDAPASPGTVYPAAARSVVVLWAYHAIAGRQAG